MQDHFLELIKHIGEDPERPGLVKTPERAARAFSYLTSGYQQSIPEIVNGALFPVENRSMVLVKDIEFFSMCEHHMLPFWGKVHVGYIPNKQVIGLSKIPRIVDAFSRRLQIQEELGHQIAKTIMDVTEGSGAAVVIDAQHLCMMMRGVEKQHSCTTTCSVLGGFKNDPMTRQEFFQHLQRK
jgi:GTP cyclohydrolase IA